MSSACPRLVVIIEDQRRTDASETPDAPDAITPGGEVNAASRPVRMRCSYCQFEWVGTDKRCPQCLPHRALRSFSSSILAPGGLDSVTFGDCGESYAAVSQPPDPLANVACATRGLSSAVISPENARCADDGSPALPQLPAVRPLSAATLSSVPPIAPSDATTARLTPCAVPSAAPVVTLRHPGDPDRGAPPSTADRPSARRPLSQRTAARVDTVERVRCPLCGSLRKVWADCDSCAIRAAQWLSGIVHGDGTFIVGSEL